MILFFSYAGPVWYWNYVAYSEKINSTIHAVRYNSILLVSMFMGTVPSHAYKNYKATLHQEGVTTTSRLYSLGIHRDAKQAPNLARNLSATEEILCNQLHTHVDDNRLQHRHPPGWRGLKKQWLTLIKDPLPYFGVATRES